MLLETLLAATFATLVLLVLLVVKKGRNIGRADDHMIGETLLRLDRRLDATERIAIAVAERTTPLPEAYRDLTALKARTESLPETVARVDGNAKDIPLQTARLHRVEARLSLLDRIDRQLGDLHGLFHSTNGRGKSGEAAVSEILGRFPDDQWASQYRLPEGVVDFIVHTPNGRILPIDAKTGGGDAARAFTALQETLHVARAASDDTAVAEAEGRLHTASRTVAERVRRCARDLRRYLSPAAGTTPYLLMALPDPVFDALDPATRHACHDDSVLPVPMSLLHTTLSLVRRLEAHGEIDLARLSAALVRIRGARHEIEETLKNQVERAATMVVNGTRSIRNALDVIDQALLAVETTPAANTENAIALPA